MKKHLKTILIVLLMMVIISPITYGNTLPINIYINESLVDFYDVKPFIDENNRTLVPVRFLSEEFGGTVKWLSESREVVILKDDTRIILEIGSKYAKINNDTYEMDTQAIIVNGRTLVPLRFVSEAFDFEINYELKEDLNNEMSHVINIYNIHLKIASELEKFNQEKFDVSNYNLSVDDVSNLNSELIDYYPKLYYMDGFYYEYIDESVVSLQLNYLEDIEILKDKYKQLLIKTDAIIDSIISDEMTDYEKEIALHDYILKMTRYDKENQWPVESHTAYGALVNGVAVCDGYAEAFDLLLKKAGIKSKIIYGSLDGELHAWNMVEINGKEYFVDVTANDPTNNENNYMKYTFFNVPFDFMINSHVFEEDYPWINSIDENYFYKNNLYFTSTESINKFILSELSNNSEETRINFMLATDGLKEQINIDRIIQEYLLDNRNIFTQNYSYTELDCDFKYVYDVIVKFNRK
jgi:hypothetical protein